MIQYFTIEKELFLGNEDVLKQEYLNIKPSEKFRTWLIDKGLRFHLQFY